MKKSDVAMPDDEFLQYKHVILKSIAQNEEELKSLKNSVNTINDKLNDMILTIQNNSFVNSMVRWITCIAISSAATILVFFLRSQF